MELEPHEKAAQALDDNQQELIAISGGLNIEVDELVMMLQLATGRITHILDENSRDVFKKVLHAPLPDGVMAQLSKYARLLIEHGLWDRDNLIDWTKESFGVPRSVANLAIEKETLMAGSRFKWHHP